MTDQAISSIDHLIRQAQVLGLHLNQHTPENARHILSKADQDKRPLSQEEQQVLCRASGVNHHWINQLQNEAQSLVSKARAQLLETQPELIRPNGALYPEHRAEACWRDCWQFLRVIIYAVALDTPDFTHPEGMHALRALYEALNVPRQGLTIALDALKKQCLLVLQRDESTREANCLEQAFSHLQAELNKNVVKSY